MTTAGGVSGGTMEMGYLGTDASKSMSDFGGPAGGPMPSAPRSGGGRGRAEAMAKQSGANGDRANKDMDEAGGSEMAGGVEPTVRSNFADTGVVGGVGGDRQGRDGGGGGDAAGEFEHVEDEGGGRWGRGRGWGRGRRRW